MATGVGEAAEVSEDMFGRPERRRGIDDPPLAAKLLRRHSEGPGIPEAVESAGEAQASSRVCRLEPFEEQAAEQAGEDMDGQEEARPAGAPAPPVDEYPAGDEAMDVRMVGERLARRVEDAPLSCRRRAFGTMYEGCQ